MTSFKDLVPLVAFWYPNGVEEIHNCDKGKVVPNQYGLSAMIEKDGDITYYPVVEGSYIYNGDEFTSFKIIQIRKYGYSRDENGKLIKVPSRDGEFVWKVSEIYK